MTRSRVVFLALLLTLASPVAAREGSLEDVLDAWTEAVGGVEASSAPAVVELSIEGRMFGMDATVHQWVARDGRARSELDLGGLYGFLMVRGEEGAWQVDQNGKRSLLEGTDLRDYVSATELLRWRMLYDRSTADFELLDSPDSPGPSVRVTPEGGEPVTFVLDPETHLPLRWENPEQERTEVATVEGWLTHEGVKLLAAWRESRGDPQYDAHFEVVDVVFHEEVDPALFAQPEEAPDDLVFTRTPPIRDIPVELNTVHLFLQASVNGSEPLWWILDTGASITVMNRATAERLGMELEGSIEGRGAGEGTTEVKLIGDVTLSLPGAELRGQTVAAIDLERIEALMGRPLDGILGYDFLSRFVVEIDYPARRLHLHERRGWNYEGRGEILRVVMESNQPHLRARLVLEGREPLEGLFLVDTGANASVIVGRPFTDTHDLLSALDESYHYDGGFGVGGRSRKIVGRIPALRLGSLGVEQPLVGFARDEKGAHADPDVAGIIGGEVLARSLVFFDYERSRMILEPRDEWDAPYPADSFGLIFTTDGRGDFHRFTVIDTIEGSPAARAGLREGDRLVEIGGRPAASWSTHEIWEATRGRSRDLPLTIERDGERIGIVVECRPML